MPIYDVTARYLVGPKKGKLAVFKIRAPDAGKARTIFRERSQGRPMLGVPNVEKMVD